LIWSKKFKYLILHNCLWIIENSINISEKWNSKCSPLKKIKINTIKKEIDKGYAELLNGWEKWIETWKADVSDVNLNVPHWCDLSKVDPNL